MNTYKIKAYAKINLGLDVLGRLPNGYHEVKMVMQTVDIWDELTFQKTDREAGDEDPENGAGGVILTADAGELPLDQDNLICKAVSLLKEICGIKEGVRIHLKKNIPIAAGLAGGSTDAAAALTGLNRLTGGSYSWKIVASTAGGIPLDSQTMNFIIEETPNLPPAILDSPAQNLVMDGSYFRQHRSIDFTWKEVPGATSYTFALYKIDSDGRQKLVYSKKNIKSCEQRLDDLSMLDVGDFEWTVTPFSYAKDGYLEQQGRAAGHRFKIDFASPTRVENVQPGKMYGN